MGGAILSGVLESCSRDEVSGVKTKATRFIAIVNSAGLAEALKKRFEAYEDRFQIRRGENVSVIQETDIVLLAFKPYIIDLVL
jgi:pyrroline-5-carboxylate reductase